MNESNTHGITVIPVHKALILTLPGDLGFDRMEAVKERVRQGMEAHAAKALILECSGVELMDRTEFEQIRSIARMVRLHGLTTYLVGLNPWIAGYLAGGSPGNAGWTVTTRWSASSIPSAISTI